MNKDNNKKSILERLIHCSTATRKAFLNKHAPIYEDKCYQSDSVVINQMLDIISIPIHYLFDIRVTPEEFTTDYSKPQVVTVQSFLSLELHLVPSLREQNVWVDVPDGYNVVDFVFRCLFQIPTDKKDNTNILKTSYDQLIRHAKIYDETEIPLSTSLNLEKKDYASELIKNPSPTRTDIADGKKGMKVSFITFHYKNKPYIAQLFIHLFPKSAASNKISI